MRTDKPLQTGVALFLLAFGLGLFAFHFFRHPAGAGFDGDVKVTLGIAGVGLLLLPFDFSNVRSAAGVMGRRATGMFRSQESPASGGDSSPSEKP